MSVNYQIHNLFHQISFRNKRHKLNIFYTDTHSLFDKAIQGSDEFLYIDHSVFQQHPLSYGLCYINDPLDFAKNIEIYNKLYANKIIFYHNNPPKDIKKEDLYLLNTTLENYISFSFCKHSHAWNNKNIQYIDYGIKIPKTSINDKPGNIIILDSQNNKQSRLLHDNLKQRYADTNLLKLDTSYDLDEVLLEISKYKICIDIDSYYNVLCGLGVGCYGITARPTSDVEFIYTISDYNTMTGIIDKLLSKYSNRTEDMQKYVNDQYNYNKFIQNIAEINYNNLNRAVIL